MKIYTYSQMAIISLHTRSFFNASMFLTRSDNLFIYHYINHFYQKIGFDYGAEINNRFNGLTIKDREPE